MNLQEVGCGSINSIDLAQDRVWWWALLNAVKKTFGFHRMGRIYIYNT